MATKNFKWELPPIESIWSDLNIIGNLRVSSQDNRYPIESIFGEDGEGWRAAKGGKQTIGLFFKSPRRIRRITLQFRESKLERTQELTLQWSKDEINGLQPLFQQWCTFSPNGLTSKEVDHQTDLEEVRVIQIAIDPDLWRGRGIASLVRLRLA